MAGALGGLFDLEDPMTQLGIGLLGGQSPHFGTNLMQALMYQAQMADQAQKKKLAAMQLESGGLDLEQKKRTMAGQQQIAQMLQARLQGQPQGPQMPPVGQNFMGANPDYQPQAVPGPKGAIATPAPAGGTRMDTFNKYSGLAEDFEKLGTPAALERAKVYRDLAEKYRPEIKEVKTMTKGGQRVQVAIYKDGTSEVMPFNPDLEKAHFADTGNSILPLDPFSGKPVGGGQQKTMTPDAVASNTLGWANFNKPQVLETGTGPMAVSPTKAGGLNATPITANGQSIAPKTPESLRKEVADLDAQLGIVRGGIQAANATPTAFGMKRGLSTLAGTIPESVAGRFDSSKEREARSYVYNVVSGVIKERAGSAQTPQELARLRTFLPAETDTNAQIADKLKSFEKYLIDKRNAFGNSNASSTVAPGGWSIKPIN